MNFYKSFLKNIEKKSGLSISQINAKDPCEIRDHFEKKFGSKTIFYSEFPFIGRGNVLRDGLYDKEKLNDEVDRILNSTT